MKILIIDDIRTISEVQTIQAVIMADGKESRGKVNISDGATVTLARGFSAIKSLIDIEYDVIFLDHDLGDVDPDTMLPYSKPLDIVSVLPMLNQRGFIRPKTTYVVHSMNPIGRKNIVDKIKNYLKEN